MSSRPADGTTAAKSPATPALPAQPRLRVLAGPNGSGKSTIQSELKPEWVGVFINADEIERELKDFDGALNLGELGIGANPSVVLRRFEKHIKNSAFAAKLGLHRLLGNMTVDKARVLKVPGPFDSYLASVLADAIRRELLVEGKTFTFETVMSSRDKVDFMEEARRRGYRVYLYFVATDDPEINLDRVRRRVMLGGHPVPDDKVRERYKKSIGLMTEACDVSHRAYIFDNSGDRHKLLVEVEEQAADVDITVHAGLLNPWFLETELWKGAHNMATEKSQVAYMPILKWKQGEHGAVKTLLAGQKANVLPIAEIQDRLFDWKDGIYKKSWDEVLDAAAVKTRNAWGRSHEIAIDLSNKLPGLPSTAWERLFSNLWSEEVQAVPVITTATELAELNSLKVVSAASGKKRWMLRYILDPGAVILPTPAIVASWFRSNAALLEQPHRQIDAVIDLGHVAGWDSAAVAPDIADIIDAVSALGSWRHLTLASGAFPKNLAGLAKGTHQIHRNDWSLFQAVRPLSSRKGRVPLFGDYGVNHIDSFEGDPRLLRMSANIRYTDGQHWAVFKAGAVQVFGYDQYVDLCKLLTALPVFKGAPFSPGDASYELKATDPAATPGNATTWRRDATNHHIHVVLDQLAKMPAV